MIMFWIASIESSLLLGNLWGAFGVLDVRGGQWRVRDRGRSDLRN
jgi:hypothetical protein